jgi:hypothetical protein
MSMLETNFTQSVNGGTYLLTSSPVKQNFSEVGLDAGEYDSLPKAWVEPKDQPSPRIQPPSAKPMRPSRTRGNDVEMGGISTSSGLTERNLSRHNLRTSRFNPMVHNFTSPISE